MQPKPLTPRLVARKDPTGSSQAQPPPSLAKRLAQSDQIPRPNRYQPRLLTHHRRKRQLPVLPAQLECHQHPISPAIDFSRDAVCVIPSSPFVNLDSREGYSGVLFIASDPAQALRSRGARLLPRLLRETPRAATGAGHGRSGLREHRRPPGDLLDVSVRIVQVTCACHPERSEGSAPVFFSIVEQILVASLLGMTGRVYWLPRTS